MGANGGGDNFMVLPIYLAHINFRGSKKHPVQKRRSIRITYNLSNKNHETLTESGEGMGSTLSVSLTEDFHF